MMMHETETRCPECGAIWTNERTCRAQFDQFLALEFQSAEYGIVHYLTVLCFNLQHPAEFTDQAWEWSAKTLEDVLERGTTTQELRARTRWEFAPGKKPYGVIGKPTLDRHYLWTMTILDVESDDPARYTAQIRDWAQSIVHTIKNYDPALFVATRKP